jgi:hypothetical protein
VSGVTGPPRRESENEPHPSIEGIDASKKREPEAGADGEKKEAKKRRIAPTLTSGSGQ